MAKCSDTMGTTIQNAPSHVSLCVQSNFYELLSIFFPNVYDVKYLTMNNPACDNLRGGLNKIADQIDVERIGPSHQAGSDSLLTAATFFKLKSAFFRCPDYYTLCRCLCVLVMCFVWGVCACCLAEM